MKKFLSAAAHEPEAVIRSRSPASDPIRVGEEQEFQ